MNYKIVRYCRLCKKKFFGTTNRFVEQYCSTCKKRNDKAKEKEKLS